MEWLITTKLSKQIKCGLLFFGLIMVIPLSGQYNNKWALGDTTGIDFSDPNNVKFIKTGLRYYRGITTSLYEPSTHTTQNDCNGKILFYSNGQFIYNRNHEIIANSYLDTGLGGTFRNSSLYNDIVLTLPNPKSENEYFLFYSHDPFGVKLKEKGRILFALLRHHPAKNDSIELVFKDKEINNDLLYTGSIGFAKHANNKDFWLLIPKNNDTLLSYLLDSNGINFSPIISRVKTMNPKFNSVVDGEILSSRLKCSHDYNFLFCSGRDYLNEGNNRILRYNFNRKTGICSNETSVFSLQLPKHLGLYEKYWTPNFEISPNDSFMYASVIFNSNFKFAINDIRYRLYQIDLKKKGVKRLIILDTAFTFTAPVQLGGDDRIYVFVDGFIYRLNQPNNKECGVEMWHRLKAPGTITTNGYRRLVQNVYSLSNRIFLQKRPELQETCIDTSLFYFVGDTMPHKLVWKFGDKDSVVQITPIQWDKPIKHKYAKSGSYPIELHAYFKECNVHKVNYDTLNVSLIPKVLLYSKRHYKGCTTDTIIWNLKTAHTDTAILWQSKKIITKIPIPTSGELSYTWILNSDSVHLIRWEFMSKSSCKLYKVDTITPKFLSRSEQLWKSEGTLKDSSSGMLILLGCSPLNVAILDQTTNYKETRLWNSLEKDTIIFLNSISVQFKAESTNIDSVFYIETESLNGCIALDSFKIKFYPPLILKVLDSLSNGCLDGNELLLNNLSSILSDSITTYWGNGEQSRWLDRIVSYNYKDTGQFQWRCVASNKNGCTDTVTGIVSIFKMPIRDYTINANNFCLGNNSIDFDPGLEKRYLIHWGDGIIDTSGLSQIQVISHHYSLDSVYEILVDVQSENDCRDTFLHPIRIFKSVKIALFTEQDTICVDDTAVYFVKVPIEFDHIKDSIRIATYYNGIYAHTSMQLEAKKLFVPFKTGPQKIAVIAQSNWGCSDTQYLTLFAKPMPSIETSIKGICKGQEINIESTWKEEIRELEYHILNTGKTKIISNPISPFVWEDSGLAIGKYLLHMKATELQGCKVEDTQEFWVFENPKADFKYTEYYKDDNSQEIQFIDYSKGSSDWYWDFGIYGNSTLQNPLIVSPLSNTMNAVLWIKNKQGCIDSLAQTVYVMRSILFSFPNVITINSDNKNDFFGVSESPWVRKIELKFYNRWGQKIYESSDKNIQWQPVFPGVYSYQINLTDLKGDQHTFTGTIHAIK